MHNIEQPVMKMIAQYIKMTKMTDATPRHSSGTEKRKQRFEKTEMQTR